MNRSESVVLIAAASFNRVIGADGAIPWACPAEQARFKEQTLGHAVIMGRKTAESLSKPLPWRLNIVVSRTLPRLWRDGVLVARHLPEAKNFALEWELEHSPGQTPRIMVIGGRDLYAAALPEASEIWLSVLHTTVAGDTAFPDLNYRDWQVVDQGYEPASSPPFMFYKLMRPEAAMKRRAGGCVAEFPKWFNWPDNAEFDKWRMLTHDHPVTT